MDGKSFSVGQNLFGFLSAARERVASGTATADIGPYWIDAVCIDQSNVLELNHQVLQMGMIYRNASETILWPGSMPPELLPFVSIFLKGGSDTIGKVRAAYLCRKDFAEFTTQQVLDSCMDRARSNACPASDYINRRGVY